MAVNDNIQAPSSTSRRFFFGTNVLITVLLAAIVVIAINWIGHRKNYRRDMAGGLGGTRLSERAQRVLDKASPDLRITAIYASDDPESDRKKYFPKVQDLLGEIEQYNKKIKVESLHTGDERAKLRDRVQQKFGSASKQYDEVISLAGSTWTEFENVVGPVRKEMEEILASDSWLSGFSTMANVNSLLKKDQETIEQARKDIDELVKSEGLPRYQEANSKIRTTNDDLKKHLESAQKWMQEMNKLIAVLSDPKSEFATKTRDKLNEQAALLLQLQKTAGDPKDQSVPDDPKPLLQEFARHANKLASWLVEESSRVDAFVKAHPAMERHPKWLVRAQQGPFVAEMPLSIVVGQSAEDLSATAQALRQILAQNVPKDQLQNYVRQIRQLAQRVSEQLDIWRVNVLAILDDSAKIDKNGREAQLLAKGGDGALFKPILDKLNEVGTKITALPALKLDEIGTRLQQDNIIVVENDNDVRVVTFDEMWPVADPMASQFGKADDAQRRVFAGDSPISSAILSLQSDKPVATIILVGYENEPPPQMRQMGRGRNTGPIPLDRLSTLKEKLEQANFKVKDWNLAAEGDGAKRPEPEEGTKPIYVILPPASQQQPNFMMPQQEKSFGEAELNKVKEALAKDGRAIFLAVFEPTTPFGPPPKYEYDQMLQEQWGIDVMESYRVIPVVADTRNPGHYSINLMQWYYMPVNAFNPDNPIGSPLRQRRVLMRELCPVKVAEKVPADVSVTPIVEIPSGSVNAWAEQDVGRLIKALRSPDGGSFTREESSSIAPPFPIGVSAENSKTGTKVVVLGTGMSLSDDYLTQRVMRIEGKQSKLVTAPPPTENAELIINAMYWLGGRPELIAAGPADIPLVPAIRSRTAILAVTFGWAVAVLVVGGAVMIVRRK